MSSGQRWMEMGGPGEGKDKYKEKEKVLFWDTKPSTVRIKGENNEAVMYTVYFRG